MKTIDADYSLCEIPELEESDFGFSVSNCPRIEDADGFGHMGDFMSIAIDACN